ncbi:protein of unknown function [Streptantibioticus cattleyicolor NRRL 8057 = DSM 46488]|nr:protein of unknown function [Streptantibioticus cattleyicolor NRRL 8057 = DSM 46488]
MSHSWRLPSRGWLAWDAAGPAAPGRFADRDRGDRRARPGMLRGAPDESRKRGTVWERPSRSR